MSPLHKTENGWKVDKPSLITWLITILIGAAIAIPGTYYGMKYTSADHEKRIIIVETENKSQNSRLAMVETYVTQDVVQTDWLKESIKDIKDALKDIRNDQKRRQKSEGQ